MKIIIFADVHYFAGEISSAIFNTERKLVRYALPLLDRLTEKINKEYRADLAVNLGDIIQDTVDHAKDLEALQFMFERLKRIRCPCYSVLGNHDLKMMDSVSEVEEILGYKSSYSFDKDGFHLVFLTTEVRPELGTERGGCYKAQYLSEQTLGWLKTDLKNNDLPVLIFTHYGIAENKSINDECMFMKNRRELKDIIEADGKVKAVFAGHQHLTTHIIENGIDYYHIDSLISCRSKNGVPSAQYLEVDAADGGIRVKNKRIRFTEIMNENNTELKISGAIFDMDGTLVDSLGFWEALWKSLGEKYLGDPTFIPDPVTQKGVRTSTLYDAMSLVHQNCGIASSTDELFQYVEDMLFRYYRDTVCLKSGVREFLEYLKKRGVKMCVATATAPNLVAVLMKKFGLDEFFPKVISCNDVGKGKEHPDVFIKANEYLGTPKEQTWIFEDSCVALETAAKEGYSTVGIFDKHNFGAEEVENICTVFIGEGDSLRLLIK